MDKGTVDLVDVTLRHTPTGDEANPFKDGRKPILNLLKAGAEVGKLDEAVGLTCRRYCLRPLAVLEWFTAKMEHMTAETSQQIEALRQCENRKK